MDKLTENYKWIQNLFQFLFIDALQNDFFKFIN